LIQQSCATTMIKSNSKHSENWKDKTTNSASNSNNTAAHYYA